MVPPVPVAPATVHVSTTVPATKGRMKEGDPIRFFTGQNRLLWSRHCCREADSVYSRGFGGLTGCCHGIAPVALIFRR